MYQTLFRQPTAWIFILKLCRRIGRRTHTHNTQYTIVLTYTHAPSPVSTFFLCYQQSDSYYSRLSTTLESQWAIDRLNISPFSVRPTLPSHISSLQSHIYRKKELPPGHFSFYYTWEYISSQALLSHA